MTDKTYIVENANNPIESDFYKDIIQKDSNGNPLVDDQNRIRIKRYVVHGSVGLNEASVDAKINAAKTELNSALSSLSQNLSAFLDSDDTDLDQLSELITEIKANKNSINALVSDKATKTELNQAIAEMSEKANAISISNTAPDVASLANASGVLHPSQDIITETPDVSILALQQNLWAYDATKDYAVGSFVIYNNSIYQCLVANGPSSTVANPSNVVYWTQIPTIEDLKNKFVPTGTILLYAGSVLPDSYLGCQGAPFDPVTYADLYAKIGTTYGGTAESPLLPDFRNRYPIGAGTNAVGTYIAEQLPNITGTIGKILDVVSIDAHGPFYKGAVYWPNRIAAGNDYGVATIDFSLANSNSIYTDNGKVYPASIALNFIIKT